MQVLQEKVPVSKIKTGPLNPGQCSAATQTVELQAQAEF